MSHKRHWNSKQLNYLAPTHLPWLVEVRGWQKLGWDVTEVNVNKRQREMQAASDAEVERKRADFIAASQAEIERREAERRAQEAQKTG